jgi:hypothetical protein
MSQYERPEVLATHTIEELAAEAAACVDYTPYPPPAP